MKKNLLAFMLIYCTNLNAGDLSELNLDYRLISIIVLVLIIAYFIRIYNDFISLNTSIESSWSDIDIQIKRRYNLIPALVNTVKGYTQYESKTLEDVISARQKGLDASSIGETQDAQNFLSNALGKLFAVTEAYPDLKADSMFLNLQHELSSMEDNIQNARRYYNAVSREYNAKIDTFPDLIISKRFNFTKVEYFKIEEQSKRVMPKIEF